MTRNVLVLNASYEPLTNVSWERAISLVVSGKAVIDESDDERTIKSKYEEFPYPKTIRLLRYIRVPYRWGPEPYSKIGVLKRDKFVCCYCGKHADTVDHVKPVSRWPELDRDWENIVAACVNCNQVKKRDMTPEEADMKMLFQPFTPYGVRRRLT